MKNDLDAIMKEREIDALFVLGPGQHNPAMVYLTGGGHLTNAYLVKKRGSQPVLYYHSMERDEAARSGLETRNADEINYRELLDQANGDRVLASALRFKKILEDSGVSSGRVAVYGLTEFSSLFAVISALQEIAPGLSLVGEPGDDSIFLRARETKDETEIERIRRMGKITTEVVGLTADYLTSHSVNDDEVLIKSDGAPLTIADVKNQIDLWLAERGAQNPEGTIFAIGRDAGVPHSSGTGSDVIRLGKTIVFDIFPCEAGGGYFYDFTRTWSLGYASDEALKLYEDVRSVFETIMKEFRSGQPFTAYNRRTCELFGSMGHPNPVTHPKTQEGFVHSLGHGLGLNVHERPWSGLTAADDNFLQPGAVFTVEPGLYYPEKGMGVRLEDSVFVLPDGSIEVFAEYPLDFVLPMKSN